MGHKKYLSSQNTLQAEREHYVIDNLNLVYHILKTKLKIPMTDSYYNDYVQEGLYALTLAAARYDEHAEANFSTFASTYIEGYMRRYRREFANCSLRIPRQMLDMMPAIFTLQNEGYSDEEIVERLNMKGMDLRNLMHVIAPASLDAPVGFDSENTLLLSEVIEGGTDGFDALESDDNIDYYIGLVADSLKGDSLKGIWYDYIYSAVFDQPVHHIVLAEKYNFSQSYVSRVLMKAKKQLQDYLENISPSITHHLDTNGS